MGKSRTPRYVVEFDHMTGAVEWNRKYMGAPNAANLEKMVAHYNASLRPGGANDHLELESFGAAVLIDQKAPADSRVIATL